MTGSPFEPAEPIGELKLPDGYGEFAAVNREDIPRDVLDQPPARLVTWPFWVACVGTTVALTVRLVALQLVEGSSNRVLAEGNRIRSRSIEAPRGLILDRQGRPLATNTARFALELVPADLPRSVEDRWNVYETVAPIVGVEPGAIKQEVEQAGLFSLDPVTLVDDLSHQRSLELELTVVGVPGVSVAERSVRKYEPSGALAHVLGYTGKITTSELDEHPTYRITSQIGKTGVEQTRDALLRGVPGTTEVEVDSRGYAQRTVATQPPVPGKHLVLGIDAELQRVATEALTTMLAERQASAGVVVGVDPRDGTVRLMVSLPTFDNNRFSHRLSQAELDALASDPLDPLTNRAIAGLYPPGSTLKPLVATAGLAEGVITPTTTIDAPAEIRIGEFVFPDWKRHGIVDVRRAIAVSSNVFFYAVGGGWDRIRGLGIDRLDEHLERFGLGRLTGVDLVGEQAGLLPTPSWKRDRTKQPWYIGDTYHLSIGQGDLLTTPIQLGNAVAAIANGGTLWQPRLVEATVDPVTDTREPLPPVERATSIEPAEALQVVREGMRQTVESGSARSLATFPIAIAGKTGTAQFGTEGKTHAWFASFAPYESPELVLVVLVEGGGEGFDTAAPIARTIYQWLVDHGFGIR